MRAPAAMILVATGWGGLAAQAPAAAPSAPALDAAQLAPRRDSLQIMIQGSLVGTQVMEITIDDGTVVVAERTVIPLMEMNQDTRVAMDAVTLALRKVHQTGRLGAQAVETHLCVAGERITGRVRTPRPGGQLTVAEIDTVFPEGTIESSQLAAVVPALALEEGAAFAVNVFDASDGSLTPHTIRVVATETVTVPAGTFDVFAVVVTGGPFPTSMSVTRAAPRRIVRIEMAGQPLVVELVRECAWPTRPGAGDGDHVENAMGGAAPTMHRFVVMTPPQAPGRAGPAPGGQVAGT